MKQPRVYMCSPSPSPLPPPSPPIPARFSQCTRSEHLSHEKTAEETEYVHSPSIRGYLRKRVSWRVLWKESTVFGPSSLHAHLRSTSAYGGNSLVQGLGVQNSGSLVLTNWAFLNRLFCHSVPRFHICKTGRIIMDSMLLLAKSLENTWHQVTSDNCCLCAVSLRLPYSLAALPCVIPPLCLRSRCERGEHSKVFYPSILLFPWDLCLLLLIKHLCSLYCLQRIFTFFTEFYLHTNTVLLRIGRMQCLQNGRRFFFFFAFIPPQSIDFDSHHRGEYPNGSLGVSAQLFFNY